MWLLPPFLQALLKGISLSKAHPDHARSIVPPLAFPGPDPDPRPPCHSLLVALRHVLIVTFLI